MAVEDAKARAYRRMVARVHRGQMGRNECIMRICTEAHETQDGQPRSSNAPGSCSPLTAGLSLAHAFSQFISGTSFSLVSRVTGGKRDVSTVIRHPHATRRTHSVSSSRDGRARSSVRGWA
jgi:hypothetical protein